MPQIDGLCGDHIKVPAARILALDEAVDISHLRARDEADRNRGMNSPAFFQHADFSVKNVEAAAPEIAEAGGAAFLVEVARIAEFNSVVGAFGDGHLMEIAKNGAGVDEVIRNR